MADRHTVDASIEAVRRYAGVPSSTSRASAANLALTLDDEMTTNVVPLIMSCRESFFLEYRDLPLVNDQRLYLIPGDAIGSRVAKIMLVDSDGTENRMLDQHTIGQDDPLHWPTSGYGFRLEASSIRLSWEPRAGGSLRVYYYRRPPNLVLNSACGKVTAIDGSGNLTIDTDIGLSANTDVLIMRTSSPLKPILESSVSSVPGALQYALADATANVAVGDYVSLAGETCVIPLPVEAVQYLNHTTTAKLQQFLDNIQAMKVAEMRAEQARAALLNVLTPRAEVPSKKVTSRGRSPWHRGGGWGGW